MPRPCRLIFGFGSIIADDMGLGKTLQVIVMLLKLKEEGALDSRQALIVVPTTLAFIFMILVIHFRSVPKAIIIIMMFWGRLGALTLLFAFTRPATTRRVKFPEEKVLIG